jgi:hypothetical protein
MCQVADGWDISVLGTTTNAGTVGTGRLWEGSTAGGFNIVWFTTVGLLQLDCTTAWLDV